MTPAHALAAADDTRLAVTGFLVGQADGPLWLSTDLAESDPPQPAGPAVRVHGLAVEAVPGVTRRADGAVWSAGRVTVQGIMRGGVLMALEAQN